jgi:hypothetical protein
MGMEDLSLGVKQSGRKANNSPPTNDEVNNEWSYTSDPQYVFMAWCLVKRRDLLLANLACNSSTEKV